MTTPEPAAAAEHHPDENLLAAPEQVLATLNQDGTRRWIRPRLSAGRFLTARRGVAWLLMAVFVVVPFLRIGDKPVLLLDLVHREFTLLGTTFRPTDTPYLMLLLLALFFSIFLVTALAGRVWCGWACPQTVYMEFLYRPIERLFEGSPQEQQRRDREGTDARRLLKNAVFLLLSFFVANTFLAYFVGTEALLTWVRRSPLEHPTAFLVMAGTTAAMFFDFSWFREQTCLVVCPYGRLQSVLLDRSSLIVGYDPVRGEPRGKPKKKLPVVAGEAAPARGDCVDCGACVVTCPTGIDIRNGLQMECIGCAQCIDACDAIMTRLGKPVGLIRYGSQAELAREPSRIVRPRVLVYSALIVVLLALFALTLSRREPLKVRLLRSRTPYALMDGGLVQNTLELKVENYSDGPRTVTLSLPDVPGARVLAPPLQAAQGDQVGSTVIVIVPQESFHGGRLEAVFHMEDDRGGKRELPFRLLGPER